MAVAGGVMSIGSPGDGADVCRIGGWSIGTVRAIVWPNSGSLKKGLRCALSSMESIVASPINVSPYASRIAELDRTRTPEWIC
jgi:hypothetical protein